MLVLGRGNPQHDQQDVTPPPPEAKVISLEPVAGLAHTGKP